ncbi:MAG: MMPL family transporter [Actinobacteria bacterium]|nr:MAG: MMPL family transporter [Actinomycetota bacterium]
MTERLARACSRHPWRTIGAWIGALVLAFAAIALLLPGKLTSNGGAAGNPEFRQAERIEFGAFPYNPRRDFTDIVLVRSSRYTIDQPAFRAFVGNLAQEGRATGKVHDAQIYYQTHDSSLVSRDKHALIIPISVYDTSDIKPINQLVERNNGRAGFETAITGNDVRDNDFDQLSQDDLKSGELEFGLPAALIILVLVFGSVVAGLVPLLLAILAIVGGLGLVAVVSQIWELSIFVVNMLTGMGLALGIDYSLFVISRYREERTGGREPSEAIDAAGATASRAVLFSGSAFVIAMLGMLIVPNTIMRSLAAGAILVGVTSLAAALTLLPALLGLLGDRVNSLRIPLFGGTSEGRFWNAVVRRVLSRPALSLLLASSLLIVAAIPVLSLKIGTNGVSTLPDRFVSKQGYLALQENFPDATANPVRIVVADHASDPRVRSALKQLQTRLAGDPEFGPGPVRFAPGGEVAALDVPIRGDDAGDQALTAVRNLRSTVIPDFFGDTGARVLVGGRTAENVDYADSVTHPTPYVFIFVLGFTLVLLTLAFRSIVVAGTAIVLNLLSVGAAYGLIVLVFEKGIGNGIFGFEQVDVIEAWVPLFLFSVLFGLSMDYQVFLLSRIKERYDETGDTTASVTWGVATTARIITGAALIIVAVFAGFAKGDLVQFQQMGFGVAIALLIDATVIRSVILPSAMKLLGRWNWYLPSWLGWLPRVAIERSAA